MNRKSDWQWIEDVVHASEGISQLRQLVLELAMTGRLVKPPTEYSPVEVEVDGVIQKIPAKVRESIRYRRSSEKNIVLVESKPAHWHSVFLEELAFLQTGATPSRTKPAYFQGDIKWLVSGDVNNPSIKDCNGRISQQALEDTNCKIIPKDSVLIALNGQGKTRGTVAVLRVEASCNQSLIGITPRDPKVLTCEFLFWYLKCNYMNIRKITGLDDRRGLNMNHVSAFQIQVPPLIEQNLIVDRINELMVLCDDLENRIAERDLLSNFAQKSLVDAVSTAHTPEELQIAWQRIQNNWDTVTHSKESVNNLRQLALGLAFNGQLLESTERSQKNWVPTTLGVLCDVRDGTHDSPRKSSTGFPLVTSKNLKKGSVDLSNAYLISNDDYLEISKRSRVDKFDVLISMIGTVGEVAVERNVPFYAIKNIGLIKTGSEILARFIAHYLISPQAKSYLDTAVSGGVQKFLSLGKLREMPIFVPDPVVQEQVIQKLDELMIICEKLENERQKASELSRRFVRSVISGAT
jgi:type I restriction enzyme S subunit